jgi:DNA polymerase-3 subunit gamma/tau
VDRCHRFDFQRPSLEQIAGVVRRVADEEGIELPETAIGMLARSATGSFRDALGTLEQLVTYGGKEVKLDDVLQVLGVADAELVLAAAEALVDHDPRAALTAVEKVSSSGRDLTQFMRDLAAHLRHLFVVQTMGEVPDSFSVTAEHTDRLATQADRLSQGEVLRAIDLIASALSTVKDGTEPRIALEVALLKAVQPQSDMSLQALMFRIEQLERGSAPPASGVRPPASGTAPPPQGAVASGGPAPARAVAQSAPEPEEEAEVEPAPEGMPAVDLVRLQELWPAVLDTVRAENAMVAALLTDARPTAMEGSGVTVAFPEDAEFSRRKAEANSDLLRTALQGITGHSFGVAFELGREVATPQPAVLGEEELLERLKHEFCAKEVFDEE